MAVIVTDVDKLVFTEHYCVAEPSTACVWLAKDVHVLFATCICRPLS